MSPCFRELRGAEIPGVLHSGPMPTDLPQPLGRSHLFTVAASVWLPRRAEGEAALRRAGLHVLTGACVQAFAVLPLAQQLAMFAKLCQGDESLADGASPLMACCLHQHGNHVVQKAVTCLPAERLQSLVDECAGHLGSVSCDSYGCRVVQRLLERCTADQRQVLVPPLLRLAPTLMVDPFGNYILHHLLEFGEPQARCVFDIALLHAGATHGSVFAIAAGLLSLR